MPYDPETGEKLPEVEIVLPGPADVEALLSFLRLVPTENNVAIVKDWLTAREVAEAPTVSDVPVEQTVSDVPVYPAVPAV